MVNRINSVQATRSYKPAVFSALVHVILAGDCMPAAWGADVIVLKRLESALRSGPSMAWLKVQESEGAGCAPVQGRALGHDHPGSQSVSAKPHPANACLGT